TQRRYEEIAKVTKKTTIINRFPREICFRFLGSFQVYADNRLVNSPRPQGVALLLVLLTADRGGASRDDCKRWARDSTDVPNDRLNELVYELRDWLKPLGLAQRLKTNSSTGQRSLDVPKEWVDVHRFAKLIRAADAAQHGAPSQAVRDYRAALDLY